MKICKISNSEKFLTEIFKIKIGLSPDLMSDTFEFNEKQYSLQINLQFMPEDPNKKIWFIIFF